MFFSSAAFTTLHVLISLAAIVAGLVVLADLLAGRHRRRLVASFLGLTVLTSLTGFLFPISVFTPALGFGVISMVLLALACYALYVRRLSGRWRVIYVATALSALYLNVFVLVVQAFQKLPALNALAPTGAEPPFAVAQGLVLAGFVVSGWLALRRFRPGVVA
ncbi:hypothetical protein [Methylobrevis pamukkalensis]|uniref:DUF2306 domain-containing protein n=1 Tax=Methylobrevis pamukkalensis TaxID=1439726 RepID=A0A1E3H9B1_9HYPH|nr:hypothetical protein [Methylobrevis pamukkalensis]ODN72376.1 hypothetical protein A6302_00303 [Methylobrevis pamukkalensis]